MAANLGANNLFEAACNAGLVIGPATEIVIQATPYCNLRCSYCYLPLESRKNRARMPSNMPADIIEYLIKQGIANNEMIIRWHAGEPCAAGIKFYEDAIQEINRRMPDGYSCRHSIQTNATYLNDDWCKLFLDHKFMVGVSLDGPEFLHDMHRVTRGNHGTHKLTMRGIEILKKNNVYFDAIAVITPDSLNYPNEIYDFFESIGINYLALNVEESEVANISKISQVSDFHKRYEVFFKKIYSRQIYGGVEVREIRERKDAVLFGVNGIASLLTKPFFVFTVDHKGNFSTFGPELSGVTHARYGDFNLGNIYQDSIVDIVATEKFSAIYSDIQAGISLCKNKCEYFFLCGGGAPGNKLYENGSFCSADTNYCLSKIKIPIDTVVSSLVQLQKMPGEH